MAASASSRSARSEGVQLGWVERLVEGLPLKLDEPRRLPALDAARHERVDRLLEDVHRLSELGGCPPRRRGRVVQLVREPGGERAQRGELLTLANRRLGVRLDRCDQPDDSPGDLRAAPDQAPERITVELDYRRCLLHPPGRQSRLAGQEVDSAGVARRGARSQHHLLAVDGPSPLDSPGGEDDELLCCIAFIDQYLAGREGALPTGCSERRERRGVELVEQVE